MSKPTHLPPQTEAEEDKNTARQAELDAKVAEMDKARSAFSQLQFGQMAAKLAANKSPNAVLQAELDQATAKIAELKAEMTKCEEEILRTTRTVLDEINQQQRKISQQAAADHAQAKQGMLDELDKAQKKTFSELAEASSRFEAAKEKFDSELKTWQTQSSKLLQKMEQEFSSQAEKQDKDYTAL